MTSLDYPTQEICPREDTIDEFASKVQGMEKVMVPDPYRWLEDSDSDRSKKWIGHQVGIFDKYMQENCAETKQRVKNLLEERWNFERFSCPFKRGDSYYFFHNSGLQNQSVLYTQSSLDGEKTVMLDPNLLSDDGTAALKHVAFSKDGSQLVYGVSRSGSDWTTLYIKNVESRKDSADVLEWVKFSSISWLHDNSGFFYCRYPKPQKFESEEDENFSRGTEVESMSRQMVYFHKLGTPQADDIEVYFEEGNPQYMYSVEVTDCGEYLIICTSESCEPQNKVHVFSLKQGLDFKHPLTIVDDFRGQFDYVTNEGKSFLFMTNYNSPNNRIISIDIDNPSEESWKEIICEESDSLISFVSCVDQDKLVVSKLKNVRESLLLYGTDGHLLETIEDSAIATVDGISGRKEDAEIFFQISSFLQPGTIYRFDLKSKQKSKFLETSVPGLVPDDYSVSQEFYASKDGTQIPMFIIHRKELQKTADNPVLLYGYGGFNISLTPSFSVVRWTFMDAFNGICAIPNLRGGGEFGRNWHKQGILNNKQNTFDDFQCAAEYLIKEKFTNSSQICINGGSNGGLLVGACLNQRPDLFGCAVAQVGVLDLLRFHRFTIGYAWCSDYGNADQDDFDNLFQISPLHNISCDQEYPATLITTADHDDRVVPLHSFKFAAQLQHTLGSKSFQKNPLLIRIDVKAGHGAGKPLSKTIDEYADILAFMNKSLSG